MLVLNKSITHLLSINGTYVNFCRTLEGFTALLAGYRARKMFSEPKTHWNCTIKWPKYGTQTLARYQGDKVSHFCSIYALNFRLQNTFVNFHTNPYNLRHCVTLIVTLKLQRDNTKVKQRSFKRS